MVRPSQRDKGYVRPAWTRGPEKARNKGGMDKGYAPYLRKDTFAPLTKTLKEILAMESGSQHQRLLLVKKENRGSCGFGKVGPSDERYPRDQSEEQKPRKKQFRRILVDGGSSSKIMYEPCFRNLDFSIRSRLRRCRVPMVGVSGETYHPLGIIDLQVTIGRTGRNKMVLMEFAIMKCRSPYNVIIGRTGMRSLRAVGSTIHFMIKFPTNQGILTMETSREALWECKKLERVQGS
ncbi:reverse transcriptase domain-containing protein [Tanacetum coccineum]